MNRVEGSLKITPLTSLIPLVLLGAAAAPAFAQEYASETFGGGYVTPPSTATQLIGPGQDDATASVVLPFSFVFFGRSYSNVSVSTNGWLAMGTVTATASSNPTLPSTAAPDAVIAPLWDDLRTGSGDVVTFTEGSAPNRVFVVAWEGVDTFSGATSADLAFQVRLHESSGVIELVYAAGGTWSGLSYTAGIERDDGLVAFGAPNTAADNVGHPSADFRFLPSHTDLTGTLLRDRPVAGADGLGKTTETGLPVVRAQVALVRADTGETIATSLTQFDGSFTVTALALDPAATLALEARTIGDRTRVRTSTSNAYSYRFVTGVAGVAQDLGTFTLGSGVDAQSPAFRRALNVQQAAQRGVDFMIMATAFDPFDDDPDVPPDLPEPIDLVWDLGGLAANGTTYVAAIRNTDGDIVTPARIDVNDAGGNPDPWDDAIILRAYGVHAFATISKLPPGEVQRNFVGATTEQNALVDGFAHWFAAVALDDPLLVDTKSATAADTFELEIPVPTPLFAPTVSGGVAATLWDLGDPANENHDLVDGTAIGSSSTTLHIFALIDRFMDGPTGDASYTVGDVFDALTQHLPQIGNSDVARVFIHHGSLPDDSAEPNDLPGEESPFPQGSQKLVGRVLSPFNTDRYAFTLGGAAASTLAVTVTQSAGGTSAPEFRVTLLDAADNEVAVAHNVSASDRATVRAESASPVAPGAYKAVLEWISGGAASYTVTFSTPLAVATAGLPDWTAGLPFKEDLVVTGGVPPYTYTVDLDAPGLASAESGRRITGVPTAPGDYSVRVDVTDQDAPAAAESVTFDLHINPPLALPTYFGIPAGRAVSADVGRGGTLPVWTPESAAPGGFALTGGATLLLSGTAASPGAFDVTGSALDAIGASVTSATTHVIAAAPAAGRSPVQVSAGAFFGVWFDALAGSRGDIKVRFAGTGDRPLFAALIDERGEPVELTRAPVASGFRLRLRDVAFATSGRYYLLFSNTPTEGSAFQGSLRVNPHVRPDRRELGQIGVDTPNEFVEVTFEAVAGARVDFLVRRGNAPTKIAPQVFKVFAPDGSELTLPKAHRGRRKTYALNGLRITQSGTHRVRIGATDPMTTGPVQWRFRMRVPRGVAYDADQ